MSGFEQSTSASIRSNHALSRCEDKPLVPVLQSCSLMAFGSRLRARESRSRENSKKRKRKQRTGKKQVILVALAFWEDGRREVLDWQLARSRDHTQWEVLLNR